MRPQRCAKPARAQRENPAAGLLQPVQQHESVGGGAQRHRPQGPAGELPPGGPARCSHSDVLPPYTSFVIIYTKYTGVRQSDRSVCADHQGGLVPGQRIPGQGLCEGRGPGPSDCPYHVYRTSDDIYNHCPRRPGAVKLP